MMQSRRKVEYSNVESRQWEESVSLWVDGEAPVRAEDLDTPYGRQLWDTYHLIGDVLRSRELAIEPSERFYARVSKAIDEEPTVVAPPGYASKIAVSGHRLPWRRLLCSPSRHGLD